MRAFHGCFAHERENGQLFSVDLRLVADLREAAASDDLATTIDYGKVVSSTERIFCGEPRHPVEAAALDVAKALLDGFPRTEAVTVKVTKLAPPIPTKLHAAGVEVEVRRSK